MFMALVKLFGNLRRYGTANQVEVPGETVRQVLHNICTEYEGLRNVVLAADGGALRPFIRITLNGHDIELLDGLDTAVAPQDQIAIFPPIAGGD